MFEEQKQLAAIQSDEIEEAVEEAAGLLPQAASRPAAPTAPVAIRKLRREIALLIFVLLLIENIFM